MRALWQRSWKVNHLCPMCLVALPKGWLIFPLLWSVGRNRHCRTGSSAPRNSIESSCPDWHGKCQHGASHGAVGPGGRAGTRGHVLERCGGPPSTEGPLLHSIFCLSNTCWPARLDSCVASGNGQLHVSPHVTHLGLAQALCSLAACLLLEA